MPRKPNTDKWKSNLYLNAYCYNRDGVVYTSVNHQRRATNLIWLPENKTKAIELLNERVENYNPNMKRISELFSYFKEIHFSKVSKQRQSQFIFAMIHLITTDYYCTENKLITNMIVRNTQKIKLSNSYIRLLVGCVREVFKFAIEYEYCRINPVHLSVTPKQELVRVPSFNETELELLLDYFKNTEMARLIKFLSLTGLRINEALSITDKDIFEDHFIIHGKGGADRVFPLKAIPEVKDYLKPFNIKTAGRTLRIACRELGIYKKERGFHGFRKLAINTYIQKGISPHVASNIFGHTIQVMEKYYLEKITVKKLNEIVENQMNNTLILHNVNSKQP